MSSYGSAIDATHRQVTNVDYNRWLLDPNTKASHHKDPRPSPTIMHDQASNGQPKNNTSISSPDAAQNPAEKPVKQISCTQCQVRKIKCDKVKPSCGHCIKSKLGPCEYRPPAPPRRGKRKPPETDLVSRLRRCEELLRDSGIEVDENGQVTGPDSSVGSNGDGEPALKKRHILPDRRASTDSSSPGTTQSQTTIRLAAPGKLIAEDGGQRYVESDLWRGIGAETNQADPRKLSAVGTAPGYNPGDVQECNNTGDFLFASDESSKASLASYHPSPSDAVILWDIFLTNVDPLLKTLHVPTFKSEMLEASQNVERIPSAMEALMFAIYNLAVVSMPADKVEETFGVTKTTLIVKFDNAIKKAFVKAQLLISTDFRLVQAIVIWLHAIRDTYHPHALWILSGIALRMAQRAGIHREKALANFSPFDAEMRRRSWWNLMAIDSRAAELSGSGISVFHNAYDTEIPGNYNDRDLSSDMTELPPSRTGATEMIMVSLRHEVAKFFKDNLPRGTHEDSVSTFTNLTDAKIDAFEQLLEHKFLRFCDALYPLHYITSIVGRACVGTMRLILRHPCQYRNGAEDMTEEEKESLYDQSLKLVRYQHLIHFTPSLSSKYLWHCDAYFPWHAFIYIITTICKVGDQKQATETWDLVRKTFEIYPRMITDTRRPLNVALGNLVIKAWGATGHWFPSERSSRAPMMSPLSPSKRYSASGEIVLPDFIIKLRAQRAPQIVPKGPTQHVDTSIAPSNPTRLSQPTAPGLLAQSTTSYQPGNYSHGIAQTYSGDMQADIPSFDLVDLSPEAWQEWDKLLANSQTLDFSTEFQNAGSWSMYGGME